MGSKRKISAAFFHIICALALVMIGFAHKPVGSVPTQIDLAAYVLPDGKLPTLCVTDTGTQPGKPSLSVPACDACRLAASAVLPEPTLLDHPVQPLFRAAVPRDRPYLLELASIPPGSRPRAPPASVFLI